MDGVKTSRNHFRFLTPDQDVWSQNAWDHVPPPDDQDEIIAAAIAKQKIAPVPEDEKRAYNEKPAKHWYVSLSNAVTLLCNFRKG
jgi:hypothetical protein